LGSEEVRDIAARVDFAEDPGATGGPGEEVDAGGSRSPSRTPMVNTVSFRAGHRAAFGSAFRDGYRCRCAARCVTFPSSCARRSDDTEAPTGVASGPMSAASVLMPPHALKGTPKTGPLDRRVPVNNLPHFSRGYGSNSTRDGPSSPESFHGGHECGSASLVEGPAGTFFSGPRPIGRNRESSPWDRHRIGWAVGRDAISG
jgi:hypothetical protein